MTGTTRAQMAYTPERTYASQRTRYLDTLIESLKQLAARGEVPPTELMDRIERLLEDDGKPKEAELAKDPESG